MPDTGSENGKVGIFFNVCGMLLDEIKKLYIEFYFFQLKVDSKLTESLTQSLT